MSDPANWFPDKEDQEATESGISFHSEAIEFHLAQPARLRQWISAVIEQENCSLNFLHFIFCSDEYLHQLNVEYLDHDTLTDVITFPYAPPPHIEGDIFMSIDRIRENAQSLALPFEEELHRVMIHGVLHLCGYLDKGAAAKERMTTKENQALDLLRSSFPS